MKLVYQPTNYTVVEYKGPQTIFYSASIKASLQEMGVRIPDAFKKSYGDQTVIKPDHPLFQRAFKEIHCTFVLKPPLFAWVE